MARVESDIVVDAPLRAVYNQWTQFESYPLFMEGVSQVMQLDDRRLRWRATIGGREKEWEAEIQEQLPDAHIIWRSTEGAGNAGVVRFREVPGDRTEIHLEMSYEPEGIVENVGDALGVPERRIKGDLERFREFIEARGRESGGWRGVIENSNVPGGHTRGSPAAYTGTRQDTQAGGEDITLEKLEKIEEGAHASGQTVSERERQIVEAAGLPASADPSSRRATSGDGSETARTREFTSGSEFARTSPSWGTDAWQQLRQAVTLRWPDIPSGALDNVNPDRSSLLIAIGEHIAIPRDELDREVDVLIRNYAVQASRPDAGVPHNPDSSDHGGHSIR